MQRLLSASHDVEDGSKQLCVVSWQVLHCVPGQGSPLWTAQLPAPSHVSGPLQKTPSSHGVPADAGVPTQLPLPSHWSLAVHALPSSHAVLAGAGVHPDGSPAQAKQTSTRQAALHPSPLNLFPSSHSSPESRTPSPQRFRHPERAACVREIYRIPSCFHRSCCRRGKGR